MNLQKTLKEYGLSEKQAKIYLACLELGSAPVQKISQKASLARSTVYEVLESLKEGGLISTFKKKKTKYFSAEEPQNVINLAKERVSSLEQALPEFNALYGQAKVRPTVRFYEGRQEMKIIFDEIINEADELLSFGSARDLLDTMGDFWPKFVRRRVEKKIPAKVILSESKTAYERKRLGQKDLREVRMVPAEYKHNGTIVVWANKIAMFSLKKDLVALVVESDVLAEMQRNMIKVIWDLAAKK